LAAHYRNPLGPKALDKQQRDRPAALEHADPKLQNRLQNETWRHFRRGVLYFTLTCLAVWLSLYALYIEFPYLQSGSDIVTAAKRSHSLAHHLFDDDARFRIMVFGDSKTLAAFDPRVFDEQLAQHGVSMKVQSFNEGLPGERRFVIYLEKLLASGIRPTHVLAQFPPVEADHETTWIEWLQHDKMIVDTLFPFRTLPRNLALFLFSAAGHGGISNFYRESRQLAQQVISDRGYYFIRGQSHFPGDRLPDDYSLATDTPRRTFDRQIDTSSVAFARLAALSRRYGFKVIFFPAPYRTGEFAPAPTRAPAIAEIAARPRFAVAGEDYWLMPPRYFSDPIHTNTSGAQTYSARLASLLAPLLQPDDR
jgi:hypothetical protein